MMFVIPVSCHKLACFFHCTAFAFGTELPLLAIVINVGLVDIGRANVLPERKWLGTGVIVMDRSGAAGLLVGASSGALLVAATTTRVVAMSGIATATATTMSTTTTPATIATSSTATVAIATIGATQRTVWCNVPLCIAVVAHHICCRKLESKGWPMVISHQIRMILLQNSNESKRTI